MNQAAAHEPSAETADLRPSSARLLALTRDAAALIGRFDHVTRLPNRLQFIDDYTSLARPRRGGRLLMMVSVAEAKHFNEILRALGHAFADGCMRVAASILSGLLPQDVELYHVSVLSFAVVIDHDEMGTLPPLAAAVASAFHNPVEVSNIPIKIRIGIGLRQLDSEIDPAEALRAALTASQDSRGTDKVWAWYNHRTDAAHIRAFRILADLPAALDATDQLSLHFQPRIDLGSGQTKGAEALIRWQHPTLGSIPPADFIPLAEQTALMGPLTDWVVRNALNHASALHRRGRELRISINASPVSLSEPGFDEAVLKMCAQHGVRPDLMEIEFTEGTLARDQEHASGQLNRLRSAGVDVAIDDFGSGFANLNYLTTIPADVLKIDQSFVRPISEAPESTFLVRQIIEMAHGLDFRVCAEGIESATAYDFLRDLGCNEGQGYFMARPMSATALDAWLDARD